MAALGGLGVVVVVVMVILKFEDVLIGFNTLSRDDNRNKCSDNAKLVWGGAFWGMYDL